MNVVSQKIAMAKSCPSWTIVWIKLSHLQIVLNRCCVITFSAAEFSHFRKILEVSYNVTFILVVICFWGDRLEMGKLGILTNLVLGMLLKHKLVQYLPLIFRYVLIINTRLYLILNRQLITSLRILVGLGNLLHEATVWLLVRGLLRGHLRRLHQILVMNICLLSFHKQILKLRLSLRSCRVRIQSWGLDQLWLILLHQGIVAGLLNLISQLRLLLNLRDILSGVLLTQILGDLGALLKLRSVVR